LQQRPFNQRQPSEPEARCKDHGSGYVKFVEKKQRAVEVEVLGACFASQYVVFEAAVESAQVPKQHRHSPL
jgi:hypothetical protein